MCDPVHLKIKVHWTVFEAKIKKIAVLIRQSAAMRHVSLRVPHFLVWRCSRGFREIRGSVYLFSAPNIQYES